MRPDPRETPATLRSIASLLAGVLVVMLACPTHARPPARETPGPILGPRIEDASQRIDVNEISMVVKNTGSISYDTQTGAAGFEYPKGSGKTAIFAAGLWLGAMVGGEVRVAISDYEDEYGPGSMLGAFPDDPNRPEYKVYKLERSYPSVADRDAALLDYNAGAIPRGAPPVSILGDGTLSIPGDQMLWCVFNDADPAKHNAFGGHTLPLGVEVQLTAFAFSPPGAGPASRSVILHYTFVNKGSNELSALRVGMWVDPDLGGFTDDLVGSDPARGMGYVYNATSLDEIYGSTPPAVGIDLLRGLTGPGGAPVGMTAFISYPNGAEASTATQTYNLLQGLDFTGAPRIDPTTGLPAAVWFNGDPVTGTGWLDSAPSDRRMLLTAGPVDLNPGDSQTLDVAIVVGQGSNRLSSILKLQCGDDAMQSFFDGGFALPAPVEPSCPDLLNCPRPANYWTTESTPGGDAFTPSQLAEIAHRVDAASLYLDWSADPVANLRHALDPGYATTPLTRAIREFAAFQCNLAVSAPRITPAFGGTIFLDDATPVSCSGLSAANIGGLGATAVIGLSDASYLDEGPNPQALVGVDNGLPFFGGGAGYAADLFGSSIPSNAPGIHSCEVRFTGGAPGQYAYRYLRTLDVDGNRVYMIQDYVPVPWTVWDLDTGTQLNGAFLENGGFLTENGAWGPDESANGGRELLWVMDSAYSGDGTPDSRYFTDPDLQNMLLGRVDLRYVLFPRLASAGAVIDAGDRFRFTWGGVAPSPGVDRQFMVLAGLPPGDPAAEQGYNDISACLAGINAGLGIGTTCDVPTPTLISLAGTELAPDHVTITWYAGGTPPSGLFVERRENEAGWASLRQVLPDGSGMIEFRDTDVRPGGSYDYRLRVMEGGGVKWLGQVSVSVPLENVLQLEGFRPNPAGRDVQLVFTLTSRDRATLAVFDVSGRRIFARDVGALGPGRHVVPLARGGALPSGIYIVQLTQGDRTLTRRATAFR